MITDKIPCGFQTVEVRSIGYKFVWVRPYYHGSKYGGKPKQFKKLKRSVWNQMSKSKYFKEITNEIK